MASVLLGEPNSLPSDSAPEKRRKIPKVAFYVAGSAVGSFRHGLSMLYERQILICCFDE